MFVAFKSVRFRGQPLMNQEGGASGGGGNDPQNQPPANNETPANNEPTSSNEPPAEPNNFNPLREGKLIEPQTPNEPPAQPPVEPEELDFGGRKVKAVDPTLKELHKDWKELNSTLTQRSEREKKLEAELNTTKQLMQTMQANQWNQQQPPQQQNQPPAEQNQQQSEPSEERIQEINEKYQEMFYENPFEAQKWLLQQPEYQQIVQPIQHKAVESYMTESQQRQQQQQQQIKTSLDTVKGRYQDDFDTYIPYMDQLIDQMPHLKQQVESNPTPELIESIYYMAKGMQGGQAQQPPPEQNQPPAESNQQQQQTQPPQQQQQQPPNAQQSNGQQGTPQQVDLNDPNVIQQILNNPQIQQQIISNYVNGVNQNNQQQPMIMGNQPGGQPPSMPENKPQNIKEAGKNFRQYLKRNNSGG